MGIDEIANLDAWLTTVVARICLNTLRARRVRRAEELVAQVPDPIVDRTPQATRKLASRARRRINDAGPIPDADPAAQREVAEAFFAAGRAGDFDRLVALLDPDAVLRGDFGPGAVRSVRGAFAVAGLAHSYAQPERLVRPATVNGAAGAVICVAGWATAVMGFVVRDGRITAIDVLADPARLARLDLSAVSD